MTIQVDRQTLEAALNALGERDTPVYAARELPGGKIELWLCNRNEPVIYSPPNAKPAKKKPAKKPTATDFSVIPGVGAEISLALHNAGIHTFDDLAAAADDSLLPIPHIHTGTLRKIRQWLSTRATGGKRK